jgi:hypothetical protein
MNVWKRFRALIKVIISHVRLFMIISHMKIIAFQLSLFCKNYRFSKTILYIINRKIHGCLDIMFNTRNKSGISAHPCIILYVIWHGEGIRLQYNYVFLMIPITPNYVFNVKWNTAQFDWSIQCNTVQCSMMILDTWIVKDIDLFYFK